MKNRLAKLLAKLIDSTLFEYFFLVSLFFFIIQKLDPSANLAEFLIMVGILKLIDIQKALKKLQHNTKESSNDE